MNTLYEVAEGGQVVASFNDRHEAAEFISTNGGQLRVRAEKRTVPAAFAVFKDGTQVGDLYTDPGIAARAAKGCGGMLKMVPAPAPES
jgi:hypothetical protein